MAHAPLTRPPQLPPSTARPPARPVAEMLAELGGAVCPSVTALLEHLIDRQAQADPVARGMRS